MTRARQRRWLTAGGSVLLLAGLTALAWCGAFLLRAYLYQKKSEATLDREMRLSAAGRLAPHPIWQGAVLGRLDIPRVKVSSVILEGDDDHTLALSVAHIPGTARPGGGGNVVLAGHRDTFFRGLAKIRKQDDILITTPEGTRLYEVDSTRVVSPDDTAVIDDSSKPLLTLITCYPFHYIGPAPERFVVLAHLVGR